MKPAIVAPERSLDQRMEALERANKIRSARAQLKRDLKAGRASIRDVLRNPPEHAETMKVIDALLACPKYGRVKVTKILQLARISPSKTLGGVSVRQRSELASMLRRKEGQPIVPVTGNNAGTDPRSQHMQALERANGTRLDRARLRGEIAAGTITVADVLNDVPAAAYSMTICDLLMAQHRWGIDRAHRLLAAIPMLESKTLWSMTGRQRRAVIARVSGETETGPVVTAPEPQKLAALAPVDRVHVGVVASLRGDRLHLHLLDHAVTLCGFEITRFWSPGLNGEWASGLNARCGRCLALAHRADAAIDDGEVAA